MSARFPHLTKANNWPGLSTVDPFDLRVEFDPYLWTPDVTIHLAQTALDPSYRDVGGWATPAERDAWYDSVSDRELQVETEMHILPGVEIKLPYAFEILQDYNQIFIDFPPTPTTGGNTRSRRFYYFLQDVQYRSPSSTACIITLDEWTTHMYDIDLNYIELDRGHAPMAAVTAEEFLANPIENCEYLTIGDEEFGGSERLKHRATNIINAGPHWLVFAITADPGQSPGTYGDPDGWRTPSTNSKRTQGAFAAPSVFAVDPGDAGTLLDRMNSQAPQIVATIQAVFLIPRRLVTISGTFTYLATECHYIEPVRRLDDFLTISAEKFGYPSRYAWIAKLYTSPYAWIEISDETGRAQRIAVEETTGRLQCSTIASILAPFLTVDMYVAGIGSGTSSELSWDNMSRHTMTGSGDWTRVLRHWSIPTYAVTQNSETTFSWLNFWQRKQTDDMNDAGYDLAIQSNNLTYSLRGAGLDRQAARLVQQQQQDSDQLALAQSAEQGILNVLTTKTLDDLVIDKDLNTTLSNLQQQEFALSASNASSSAAFTNAENKVALGLAQNYETYVAIDGGLSVATAGVNTAGNLAGNVAQMNNLDNILLGRTEDLAIQTAQQGITDSINVASAVNSMNFGNLSAQASVAQAQLQLWGAKQNAMNVQATYTMAMSNNATVAQMSNLVADVKSANAIRCETDKLSRQQTRDSSSLSIQQAAQTAISNGDIAVARAQAAAIKGMSDLSVGTRKNLQDESLDNTLRASRLGSPKVFAQPTGSALNYTRPQAIMASIKTQDAGAIAAAGDVFLRYGYRMGGRQWSLSNLTPMSIFTYWEGRIRLGAGHVSAVTRETITNIFASGTTVWKNPSQIGTASIYDNRKG